MTFTPDSCKLLRSPVADTECHGAHTVGVDYIESFRKAPYIDANRFIVLAKLIIGFIEPIKKQQKAFDLEQFNIRKGEHRGTFYTLSDILKLHQSSFGLFKSGSMLNKQLHESIYP